MIASSSSYGAIENSAPPEDNLFGFDEALLDPTGRTQILSNDDGVDTATDVSTSLSDDDKTMLAGTLDDDLAAVTGGDAESSMAPYDDDEATTFADATGGMPGLAGSTDMDLDLDSLTAALNVSEVGETIIEQAIDEATVEQPRIKQDDVGALATDADDGLDHTIAPGNLSGGLNDARTMTEVGTKLDLARAYVDMGDPGGARSILEEVLDEGDASQRQQAQQLLESLPS